MKTDRSGGIVVKVLMNLLLAAVSRLTLYLKENQACINNFNLVTTLCKLIDLLPQLFNWTKKQTSQLLSLWSLKYSHKMAGTLVIIITKFLKIITNFIYKNKSYRFLKISLQQWLNFFNPSVSVFECFRFLGPCLIFTWSCYGKSNLVTYSFIFHKNRLYDPWNKTVNAANKNALPCFDCSAVMIESATLKSRVFVCSASSFSFWSNSLKSFMMQCVFKRSVHISMFCLKFLSDSRMRWVATMVTISMITWTYVCSFLWSVTSREEERHAMILIFVGKMIQDDAYVYLYFLSYDFNCATIENFKGYKNYSLHSLCDCLLSCLSCTYIHINYAI